MGDVKSSSKSSEELCRFVDALRACLDLKPIHRLYGDGPKDERVVARFGKSVPPPWEWTWTPKRGSRC